MDCENCGRLMNDLDHGRNGTATVCARCRKVWRAENARIRALVALSHEEKRLPPELAAFPRWRINCALDGVG